MSAVDGFRRYDRGSTRPQPTEPVSFPPQAAEPKLPGGRRLFVGNLERLAWVTILFAVFAYFGRACYRAEETRAEACQTTQIGAVLPTEVVVPCSVPTAQGEYALSAVKYGHPVRYPDAFATNSTSYVSVASTVSTIGSSVHGALVSFRNPEQYPDGTKTRSNDPEERNDITLILEAADVMSRCLLVSIVTTRLRFNGTRPDCNNTVALVQIVSISGDRRTLDGLLQGLEERSPGHVLPCGATDYQRMAAVAQYLHQLDSEIPIEWNCDTQRMCGRRVPTALATIRAWLV